MSYKAPLATTTEPGIVQIGAGLSVTNGIVSVTANSSSAEVGTPQITTVADGTVIIDSMTLTPGAGTYRVFFNMDFILDTVAGDITAAAATDVAALYTTLTGLTPTGTHGAVFGLGETITPGVYDVASAASINGVLTLDGGGIGTSIFVFRIAGALTSVAGSSILLTNGALSANVFWLSEGATALGADTTFVGTAFAHNAAAGAGNNTIIYGRLISNFGAITTDNNTITNPAQPSAITMGSTLSTFILFTSSGNVTNTPNGTYIGNIGTNLGVIAGYDLPTLVVGGIYPPSSIGPFPTAFSFAAYEDGVLIPLSLRNVSSTASIGDRTTGLQTTATVLAGQAIDIRSTVELGQLTANNRALTVFRV